jgi:hypothetical protein
MAGAHLCHPHQNPQPPICKSTTSSAISPINTTTKSKQPGPDASNSETAQPSRARAPSTMAAVDHRHNTKP